MRQFFFELTNGITLIDPTGLWCRDVADARDKAVVIAARVAAVEEDLLEGAPPRHICVRDDRGREVDTVVVRASPTPLIPKV
jgi:hypothetical protein